VPRRARGGHLDVGSKGTGCSGRRQPHDRTPCGVREGCHRHPHTSGCNYRKAKRMSAHTNLVCMCCGHIQPVQRDQLPSRCEHCREAFAAHGYFLDADTTDAEEVSQGILDTRVSLRG
jgi:hypothetical protein